MDINFMWIQRKKKQKKEYTKTQRRKTNFSNGLKHAEKNVISLYRRILNLRR